MLFKRFCVLRFQNSRLMTRLASSGTVTYIHIHIFVSSYSVDVFVAILRDTHNMNICPNILIFCGRSDLDTGSRIPSEHTWPPHILPIWTGLSETRSALSPLIIMIHIQHQPPLGQAGDRSKAPVVSKTVDGPSAGAGTVEKDSALAIFHVTLSPPQRKSGTLKPRETLDPSCSRFHTVSTQGFQFMINRQMKW